MSPSNGHRLDHPHDSRYAAIYGRAAVAGGSIPIQLEACQAFADQHGYTVPQAYMCLDDGYAGTSRERPGLQQLRELIRTRAIQAVIVSDLDRLSRSLTHLRLLADECAHAEVEMHAVLSPDVPALDGLRVVLHHAEADGSNKGATR